MTDAPPAFTGVAIVVPTRNRADLAELAVASAAQGTLGYPVTVLVSDNSTDDAQVARLQEFCRARGEERPGFELRYVRPGRDLPMSEHWEWARKQVAETTGASHVVYLTDRTVLKPGALDRLAAAARAFPDRVISFNNDVVDDYEQPVRLHQEDWSGELLRVPSRRLLELAAELILPRPLPRMLNVLVPVSAFQAVVAAYGGVFESVAPDFCFCFRHLSLSDDILYLDEALTVMHGLRRSNGNSTTRGVASPDTVDFLRHAGNRGGLGVGSTFPGVTTTYNVIATEYLAAEVAAAGLPPLNRTAYVRTLAKETDGFAEGAMKSANRGVLEAGGVSFGRRARLGRSVAQAGHYLGVLGVRDFLVLSGRRVTKPKPRAFPSTQAALEWACSHPVRAPAYLAAPALPDGWHDGGAVFAAGLALGRRGRPGCAPRGTSSSPPAPC